MKFGSTNTGRPSQDLWLVRILPSFWRYSINDQVGSTQFIQWWKGMLLNIFLEEKLKFLVKPTLWATNRWAQSGSLESFGDFWFGTWRPYNQSLWKGWNTSLKESEIKWNAFPIDSEINCHLFGKNELGRFPKLNWSQSSRTESKQLLR